ncbi:hypothetical protein RchiOBHm_Chr1g0354211 [Rosa chinensis]|uniref:Uncharacterized protein n=1 Tax=Rosa chinensis TaxID=74649 RepID=A0A2P6SH31_ROSCH|nr:hypothetical protein RchiOBHm_Chr1g0354211 [Rosa chinensis]
MSEVDRKFCLNKGDVLSLERGGHSSSSRVSCGTHLPFVFKCPDFRLAEIASRLKDLEISASVFVRRLSRS